jgi:putative hemolysin
MSIKRESHPFRLNGSLKVTKFPTVDQLLEAGIEKILGLKRLDDMYQALPPTSNLPDFLQVSLQKLHIHIDCADEELANIPKQGPAIVVSNHPFGGIEGIIMAYLLLQIRGDVKIMANYFLQRFPDFDDLFIGVDPFAGPKSKHNNVRPMRDAVKWVKNGGLLLVFPAGEVSHRRWFSRKVTDPQWNGGIARIAKLAKAPVTPVFFHGTNSRLFQYAGLIHPRVRTALLPHELLNKQNQTFSLRIGKNIPFKTLTSYQTENAMMQYLRVRTYMLQELQQNPSKPAKRRPAVQPNNLQTPVCDPIDPASLAAEINILDDSQCLGEVGAMQVWYAKAGEIPWVLQEIGRLRELTFRQTGEGTGKATDIDLFDDYYAHLFVWHRDHKEIVGAYRLGLTDHIIQQFGIKGLYTQTLFKYKRRFTASLYPAIEMGRSFVRREYQKNFTPLMLLWKGIGQFVARHPRYRYLFGPVSISNDYETISQQLLVEFLKCNNFHPGLARHVKPRNPFRMTAKLSVNANEFAMVTDIDQISDIVAQFEKDRKGIPVLLKQYLKLGGTLLGFNVDHDFNNALDGLIMVDLLKTDGKVIQKYMGAEQASQFLEFHNRQLRRAS